MTAASASGETFEFVMPFWGDPSQFRESVESVRGQSDPQWRLTILDDAYPDPEPGRWASGLGDERIRYVRHPRNIGINANFQASLELATADWLVIMGCDDRLHPDYLAVMRELAAAHPEAAMLHPGVRVIDDAGRPATTLVDRSKDIYRGRMPGTVLLDGEAFALSITRGNWMYFPSIAWRRRTIAPIGFRPGLDVAQDLALGLDVALAGGALVHDDRVVFDYRRHAASVSSALAVDGRRFAEEQTFFREMAGVFLQRGWRRAARAARWHLSSRVNAAVRIPAVVARRQWAGLGAIARHIVGRSAQPRTTR